MKKREYVSKEEVKKVCKELKIRDWTKIKKPSVTIKEAKIIFPLVNKDNLPIPIEDFKRGLEVELEHGIMFEAYNVTNNHPILTGMIVMAHFMESLDYYKRLEIAELEGDFLKAIASKDTDKIINYYKRLIDAKIALNIAEKVSLSDRNEN